MLCDRIRSIGAIVTLAVVLTVPALSLAEDATPAVDPLCVPYVDTLGCLPVAPESARVDLEVPTFSNPTEITNPLFPISELESVLMLGHVDGKLFRTEVSLLPGSQIIEWNGQQINARVSQYVAYLDGRVEEVAIDYYAQADDGSVWYLGEDVADYENGVIISTDGTWRVGRASAPPAMIMPANPQVGDVFRPENIPGFVFEEVTVTRTNATFNGPHGPISGCIVVSELHQDGTYSDKIFAPGYGEFRTGHLGELEALVLALPTNGLTGQIPAELDILTSGALLTFDAVESQSWSEASAIVASMSTAWNHFRIEGVPPMIEARLGEVFVEFAGAVDAGSPAEVQQAAINLAQLGFDLTGRYQALREIELARLDLWSRQLAVDAASDDPGAVTSDGTTMEVIWTRVEHTVDAVIASQIETQLDNLRLATDEEDLDAVVEAAVQLRGLIAEVQATG